MSSWWRGVYPNVRSVACSTNSTDWQIVATDGTGYATYGALIADSKTPMPADNNDLPRGAPALLVQSTAANQTAGAAVSIKTNTINTPAASDLGEGLALSGLPFTKEGAATSTVWIRKKVGTDVVIVSVGF